jgi:hypothetical protein
MRCPQCGAGVRLRVDTVPTTEYTALPADEPGLADVPTTDYTPLPGDKLAGVRTVEVDALPSPARRADRNRWWLWGAAGLAVVLVLAGVVWALARK